MQDDGPGHYARVVRDWLDDNFSGRWIGRSPDLTPADYLLWGYLKNIVYKNKP